jgi:tRNA threonylcarbamoyladenosine dehydratase
MDESNWLARTRLLIGDENQEKLRNSHVLIAGLGGVGGYAAEAVCRAGVGSMTVVDNDKVTLTNLNRQLLALRSTEGKDKTDLMAERLTVINPDLILKVHKIYLKDEKTEQVLSAGFDYVIDAIDTLSPKIFFIKQCMDRGIPLISSMGSGGRLDPMQIRISDISESSGCQFAQVVRKKLHALGIWSGFKVVYSSEPVIKGSVVVTDNSPNKKSTVGTISYMPAIFGMMAASEVIRDLIGR